LQRHVSCNNLSLEADVVPGESFDQLVYSFGIVCRRILSLFSLLCHENLFLCYFGIESDATFFQLGFLEVVELLNLVQAFVILVYGCCESFGGEFGGEL
jgi:hypothetical protein